MLQLGNTPLLLSYRILFNYMIMVQVGSLTVQSEDPQWLSHTDLRSIAAIEQNIWADDKGIWEFVHCPNCGSVHSRQDIFTHLSAELEWEVVHRVIELLSIDTISCPRCHADTNLLYDVDYCLQYIRQRYSESDSYLTTLRNEQGIIVGFMDAYVDSFKVIYHRELERYYNSIWEEKLQTLLEWIFNWALPRQILELPSMWTDPRHSDLRYLYEMVRNFVHSLPEHVASLFSITELDRGSSIHAFHHCMWVQPLQVDWWVWVGMKNDEHHSGIFYYEDFRTCRDSFPDTIRQFLWTHGRKMREIMVAT